MMLKCCWSGINGASTVFEGASERGLIGVAVGGVEPHVVPPETCYGGGLGGHGGHGGAWGVMRAMGDGV